MKIKRHGFLINVALLIASILFTLMVAEITLRMMGWKPLYVSPERDQFWKYDPLLGWAHQPGQVGVFKTSQFQTTVHINQEGLRDREHSYKRGGDIRRILVLGDSFAWGYGVEEPQRFSERIETSMGVEVINAGVSGYSTDQELLWLNGEGKKYETDLVILFFTGNDIGDIDQQLVSTIYYKPQFVDEEGRLILKGYPVPKTSPQGKLIYSISQRSALAYFLVQRYFDALSIYGGIKNNQRTGNASESGMSSTQDSFKLSLALLDEIRKTTDSMGAKFMIVATNRWWNNPSSGNYKDFVTLLRSEGYLVLDVESRPGFDPGEMLIPNDGHWSSAGHEFVAKQIEDFVTSNQLLIQSHNPDNQILLLQEVK